VLKSGENCCSVGQSAHFLIIHVTKNKWCTYKRNIEARSHNHCRHWKAINFIYSERVFVVLVIQPENSYALLYCRLWPAWMYYISPHFSTFLHISPHYFINGKIFWNKLLNIERVFGISVQLFSETSAILRTERDIVITVHWSSCKVAVILVRF
jgi:hypothetical protein